MKLLEHPATPLERSDWQPSELRRVVIRLCDGQVVQIGTAPNRESALTLAREVAAEIRNPTGDWPLLTDRVRHPHQVVSIDLLHA